MPARTYDFSNYQGGLESVLGGAAQGFTGVEALVHGLRRRRIVEGQQDATATTAEQNAVDANARANAEAGGSPGGEAPSSNPVTAGGGPGGQSPLAGVRVGEGFRVGQGTPPFSSAPTAPAASLAPSSPASDSGVSSPAPASDPAAGGQPGGGVMGAVRSLRQRAASLLLGDSPTPGVPSPTFHRTGPSDVMAAENTRAQAMRDVAGIDTAAHARDTAAEIGGRQAVANTEAAARRYEADSRAAVEREGLIRQLRTAGVQGAQAITAQLNDRVHSIEAEMRDPNALTTLMQDTDNPNAFRDWYAHEGDRLSLANEELRLAAENSAGGIGGTGANPALQRFLGAEPDLENEMAMRRAALAQVTGNDPAAQQKRSAIEQRFQQRKAALLGTRLLQQAAPPAPVGHGGGTSFQ